MEIGPFRGKRVLLPGEMPMEFTPLPNPEYIRAGEEIAKGSSEYLEFREGVYREESPFLTRKQLGL